MIELPESCYHIWKWFIDLDSSRSSNGFGIDPINYADVLAYFNLYDIEPMDYELQAIKKLDSIAIKHSVDQMKKRNKSTTAKKR